MSLRGEAEGGGVRKIMFAVDCSLLLLYHLSTAKFISHVISQRVYCYVLKGGGGRGVENLAARIPKPLTPSRTNNWGGSVVER